MLTLPSKFPPVIHWTMVILVIFGLDFVCWKIPPKTCMAQTCSVGTDHEYWYGYEAMGMGTGMGLKPWVRVRVRDHEYGYGYGYDMWQSHGYGSGHVYETIDMGMGTGTGPWVRVEWVRVQWVRVWVRVQDVKSRMKECGYNYNSYATFPVSNNSFGSFRFSMVLVGHGFINCLPSESFVVPYS